MEHFIDTSNLWSGIVSGKSKNNNVFIKKQVSQILPSKTRADSDSGKRNSDNSEYATVKFKGGETVVQPKDYRRALSGFGRAKPLGNLPNNLNSSKISSDSNSTKRDTSGSSNPFFY